MKQTYTGGCHCGAVRYEADIDLSQGTVRCNCSICAKGRTWLAGISGDDFRLLQGEGAITKYEFNTHRISHCFCKHCGVKSFAQGADKKFAAIIVSCLDGLSDEDLATIPVMYVDGRNDNFKAPPKETRHL